MAETWHPTTYRTHTLGDIQRKGAVLVGQEVTVAGFLHASRGKGAICFADLRDGTGMTQVFAKADTLGEDQLSLLQGLTRELSLIHI